MNTITQRLREIADTTEQYSDRHSRWVAENLRAIAAELEAPATDPLPVAWIRWRSDGGYEGPLMHDQMEDVRKRSGAWTPLYRHPPTEVAALRRQHEFRTRTYEELVHGWMSAALKAKDEVAALQADITSEREHASKLRETFLRMQQEQINTAKPLDDPRLQELFGCAIDGALTIGYQGGAAASNGHWLKPWWEKGRAVAEREAALQARISELEAGVDRELMRAAISARDARIADMEARINALEARQVPASASDEYTVVWPDGGRFVAGNLKSAQDYMSGAILSCAARGVEPPVIVRYVPAETVPYEPQQDSSKERP